MRSGRRLMKLKIKPLAMIRTQGVAGPLFQVSGGLSVKTIGNYIGMQIKLTPPTP